MKEVMMKEEITNLITTFEAVDPILGNALKSGQLLILSASLQNRTRIFCANMMKRVLLLYVPILIKINSHLLLKKRCWEAHLNNIV